MGRAAKWILTNGAAWRFPGSSTTRHRAASRGASRRLTADTIIAATGAQRRPRPNATGKRRHGRRFQRSHNPRDQALNLIRDGRNSGTSPPMLELASAPLINEDPPRVARPCPLHPSIPASPPSIAPSIRPSLLSAIHPPIRPPRCGGRSRPCASGARPPPRLSLSIVPLGGPAKQGPHHAPIKSSAPTPTQGSGPRSPWAAPSRQAPPGSCRPAGLPPPEARPACRRPS